MTNKKRISDEQLTELIGMEIGVRHVEWWGDQLDGVHSALAELAELRVIRKAVKQWLTAHDENMHLLGQGVLPPTDVKTAVHDGIRAIRAALPPSEPTKGE